jgi:hypothetical protein
MTMIATGEIMASGHPDLKRNFGCHGGGVGGSANTVGPEIFTAHARLLCFHPGTSACGLFFLTAGYIKVSAQCYRQVTDYTSHKQPIR